MRTAKIGPDLRLVARPQTRRHISRSKPRVMGWVTTKPRRNQKPRMKSLWNLGEDTRSGTLLENALLPLRTQCRARIVRVPS